MLGIFKGFEIWRHIDIQKFPVDEQEPFCIRQAGKLRKIVRLNLCQPRWTNLGHARCFVESKIARTPRLLDRKSTRLNSSHVSISYAVFCLKKKKYILIH